jgi:hypothetical protein
MNQVLYREPTVLEGPVNLTIIWLFLLDACELVHIFVCKEKLKQFYRIRRHHRKFSRTGDQVSGSFAPLT